jgi:hypothetical protein
VDSAERNPVIYRIYTHNKEKLRTQQNSKWLNGTCIKIELLLKVNHKKKKKIKIKVHTRLLNLIVIVF